MGGIETFISHRFFGPFAGWVIGWFECMIEGGHNAHEKGADFLFYFYFLSLPFLLECL